jgi:hypothetical protein
MYGRPATDDSKRSAPQWFAQRESNEQQGSTGAEQQRARWRRCRIARTGQHRRNLGWGAALESRSACGAVRQVVDRHIRNLRERLQDDWRKPRFIATIPGRGYRFLHTFPAAGVAAT